MRTHLLDVLNGLARQGHEVLLDAQEDLTLDLAIVLAQKFEVRKKSSGHRILYRHDGSIRHTIIHTPVQVIECQAFDYIRHGLSVLFIEKSRRLLMEAPFDTLNRYSAHINKK